MTKPFASLTAELNPNAAAAAGDSMHSRLRELFPIARSITGPGLRETLRLIDRQVSLERHEVPSGTPVHDWTVPPEWSLTEAYLEDDAGNRVVDYANSNLHVVGYSTPVDTTLDLDELQPHLHSLPEQPHLVPYRTSYYAPSWGFCLTDEVRCALRPGRYRAVIRSRLEAGHLTIGEHLHRGTSSDEVLIFAHVCHPSLANDNLSGVVVALALAEHLRGRTTRMSYRFVFAPATIGSITWLSLQGKQELGRIRHGLVLSLLGGGGRFHYKQSRRGDCEIDRAAWHVLRTTTAGARQLEFSPWGYDERQFCSPGFNLPVGRLTRTPNGEFPEYHTSADDPGFVSPAELGEAWLACLRIFDVFETNHSYINLSPHGEPQLGRRGLYRASGGHQQIPEMQLSLLWVLNQSDGSNSLLDIAMRSGLPYEVIARAAADLESVGLLRRMEHPAT